MLWNNTNFMYNGNVLFFSEWARNGITRIHDLVSNNECIPFDRIRHMIGNHPKRFLEYITMRAVVVSFLRKRLNYENCINLQNSPHFCGNQLEKARNFRETLTENNKTEPCSKRFWKRKLDYDINEPDWLLTLESTKEVRFYVFFTFEFT